MITFGRKALLALIAILVVASCGLDGGSRGTGISAAALGNVATIVTGGGKAAGSGNSGGATSVRARRQSSASVPLGGITVTVTPWGEQGATNSAGSFALRGSFESTMTLWFSRAADAIFASVVINVPAGGTLTLHNVTINNVSGNATAETQDVDFLGKIVGLDCAGQKLVLVAASHAAFDDDTYTVLLPGSSLRDQHGNPVTCTQLRDGQIARVLATVNADGSYGHAQITVE